MDTGGGRSSGGSVRVQCQRSQALSRHPRGSDDRHRASVNRQPEAPDRPAAHAAVGHLSRWRRWISLQRCPRSHCSAGLGCVAARLGLGDRHPGPSIRQARSRGGSLAAALAIRADIQRRQRLDHTVGSNPALRRRLRGALRDLPLALGGWRFEPRTGALYGRSRQWKCGRAGAYPHCNPRD